MPPNQVFSLHSSINLCIIKIYEQMISILVFAVQALARNKVVSKSFAAVESLGSTQILCSDKTETLTINRMKMEEMNFDGRFFSISAFLKSPNHGKDFQSQTFFHLMKCAILSSVAKFDNSPPREDILKITTRRDIGKQEK